VPGRRRARNFLIDAENLNLNRSPPHGGDPIVTI
jgi:hypothetical protein